MKIIYGNYISNFSPEEAYYIITDYSIVFYYSLDSLNKSSYLFDGFCYPYFPTETDTFVLGSDGWFTDSSLYKDYYFIKFEDE